VLLLPEIDALERTPDGLSMRFHVPASLRYFEGHFPDVALLPGVVQIGWAVELARKYLPPADTQRLARFRALSGVKFTRVIQPGAEVSLRLSLDAARHELAFEYHSEGHACSLGRVLFH
jgi:3-hydroxymyristoyl/3-hydroxydecanoyl-(acyl carrier protein) dehydratase